MTARILASLVGAYRFLISPLLPQACRFHPSCSSYAEEALRRHGAWRGGWLATEPALEDRLGRLEPLEADAKQVAK